MRRSAYFKPNGLFFLSTTSATTTTIAAAATPPMMMINVQLIPVEGNDALRPILGVLNCESKMHKVWLPFMFGLPVCCGKTQIMNELA